jgi:hypothetical protein
MLLTAVGCATHVQVDGQSELAAHGIVFTWHDEVDPVVVVHEGGGDGDASIVPTVTVPASTRMAGPEPVAGAPPEAPDPAEPPPEQAVIVSGTQVKPSPQSLETVQGTS